MEWTVCGTTYVWSADWWQAWGSVLALWFLVIQVTRDGRARRQRDRAMIRTAALSLHVAISNIESWVKTTEAGQERLAAKVLFEVGTLGPMRRELEAISLADLPTERSVELVMSARTALTLMLLELEKTASGLPQRPDFIESHLPALHTIHDELEGMAKKPPLWG